MSTASSEVCTPHAESVAIVNLLRSATAHSCGDFYAGKRSAKRYFADSRCELTVNGRDAAEPLLVSLHTISLSGAACWAKQPLEENTVVYLREFSADKECAWIEARVAHCTRGIRGYLTGINFVHPPSPEDLSVADQAREPDESLPDVEDGEADAARIRAARRRGLLNRLRRSA